MVTRLVSVGVTPHLKQPSHIPQHSDQNPSVISRPPTRPRRLETAGRGYFRYVDVSGSVPWRRGRGRFGWGRRFYRIKLRMGPVDRGPEQINLIQINLL